MILAPALAVAVCVSIAGCNKSSKKVAVDEPVPGKDAGAALPPRLPESAPLLERIDRAIVRGAMYLRSQQMPDGSFRSTTYAAFKDGYSLSPLALTALVVASADTSSERPDDFTEHYRHGVDFLATLIDDEGSLRKGLEGPKYPLYAITGSILVFSAPGNERHHPARDALLTELKSRQIREELGFSPEDPSIGGWGYYHGVPDPAAAGDPSLPANLSATLFAVGAMYVAGVPADDPAMRLARGFIERCQNFAGDGGFYYSPALPDGNKAGALDGQDSYRSYGSMTADGLRGLMRLGLPADHPRMRAAASWLESNYEASRNPGEFPESSEVRRESSYYYYVWSSAHALRALGKKNLATSEGEVLWPRALAVELLRRQQDDGSWKNSYSEMREDDPLVATPFALAGLLNARIMLDGVYRAHNVPVAPR